MLKSIRELFFQIFWHFKICFKCISNKGCICTREPKHHMKWKNRSFKLQSLKFPMCIVCTQTRPQSCAIWTNYKKLCHGYGHRLGCLVRNPWMFRHESHLGAHFLFQKIHIQGFMILRSAMSHSRTMWASFLFFYTFYIFFWFFFKIGSNLNAWAFICRGPTFEFFSHKLPRIMIGYPRIFFSKN